jgi:hypothetical protein
MVMKYMNSQGTVYEGDRVVGDREATVEEIAAWELSRQPTYQQLRATAYPPVTDYLDAVVKGDQEQMRAYIDACLAVKTKYPK